MPLAPSVTVFEDFVHRLNVFSIFNIGMSPRLEPFYHGQVFNANKSTQIQVLPSINVLDS